MPETWKAKMKRTSSGRFNLRLILTGLAALLLIIIVLQNTAAVETKILFATVSMPRALLLAVALLVGFLLGLFAAHRRTAREDSPRSAEAMSSEAS